MHKIRSLVDRLEEELLFTTQEIKRNGHIGDRPPGASSLTFPGLSAEVLIANPPQLVISIGSACSSGEIEPADLLLTMGMTREEADKTPLVANDRS